jgi:hypothetical protein
MKIWHFRGARADQIASSILKYSQFVWRKGETFSMCVARHFKKWKTQFVWRKEETFSMSVARHPKMHVHV